LNKIFFDGNIGADAEQKTVETNNGPYSFWTIPIAMNKYRKKDAPEEKAEWIDCSLHGKSFDSLAPHLTKGKKMIVCGDIEVRRYTTNDGTPGARLQCRVDTINFAESRASSEGSGGNMFAPQQTPHHTAKANGYAPVATPPAPSSFSPHDEIPF
jgi:single-strand DNA-binding protein